MCASMGNVAWPPLLVSVSQFAFFEAPIERPQADTRGQAGRQGKKYSAQSKAHLILFPLLFPLLHE